MDILDLINPQDLGRRLRRERKKAGLVQAYVADRLNMARTTLVAIEKGERRVKADELLAMAELYHCDLAEFFYDEPPVDWRAEFNERERKEIAFAETYAEHYGHGTDGHIRLMVIAKMAKLLGSNHEQNATD